MNYKVTDDELAALKLSLRIEQDDTLDDGLLRDCLKSAKAYVQNAVDEEVDLTKYQQYTWATMMLAQFYYNNRGSVDMKRTPYQVLSMIQQLRGLSYSKDE